MSGETEADISGWTVDTLHSHMLGLINERDRRYEQRFEAQERAVASALLSAKEAVVKAETATEKRFEGVNEFRATLADQARDLMPRRESEQMHESTRARLTALELAENRDTARNGGFGDFGTLVATALSLLIAISAVVVAVTR